MYCVCVGVKVGYGNLCDGLNCLRSDCVTNDAFLVSIQHDLRSRFVVRSSVMAFQEKITTKGSLMSIKSASPCRMEILSVLACWIFLTTIIL